MLKKNPRDRVEMKKIMENRWFTSSSDKNSNRKTSVWEWMKIRRRDENQWKGIEKWRTKDSYAHFFFIISNAVCNQFHLHLEALRTLLEVVKDDVTMVQHSAVFPLSANYLSLIYCAILLNYFNSFARNI